jgi:hypothetical protein
MTRYDDRHAAFHEAGHAVVASYFGFEVTEVAILQGPIHGFTRTNAARFDLPDEQLSSAVIVAVAGAVSESVLLGSVYATDGVRRECEDDEIILNRLLARLCPWVRVDEIRSQFENIARELVKLYRTEIHALAEQLLRDKVVFNFTLPAESTIVRP